MGTIHELLDLKNKRVFGLDKGYWYESGLDQHEPLTLDAVKEGICRARDYMRWPGREQWLADLACRIWAFCEVAEWQIDIYNDCGDYDEDEQAEWPKVDDRCPTLGVPFDPDPCEEQTRAALAKCREVAT